MTKRAKPDHVTPSLHTVTAVTRVAAFIAAPRIITTFSSPEKLAAAAFQILGHEIDTRASSDPLVQRIVESCAKILSHAKGAK